MNEREKNIVEAAVRVFMRYGVKRASMHDIASEAGVARQTLYNVYPNKDEIMRATIRLFADQAIAEIEAGLGDHPDIGAQLDLVFRHTVILHFERLHASPNAADIVEGFNATSQKEIAENSERVRVVIEGLLRPHEKAIRRAGLSVHQLSDFVQRSATAAKYNAADRKHLLLLLETLKIVTVTLISSDT